MKVKPDQFHHHEALDRANMVAEIFDEYLLDGVWVQSRADLKETAENLSADLHAFYQLIGRTEPSDEI